ncbi:peptidoglycan-binding domain-containing protein [Atopobiaceae bacterium HCP3S3_F7]|uniref:peptidoglycan-binding domain-containing protein n=1 Tax=Collinsella sp. Sow4_E3 TaxID=3438776 RepID=UPI003F90FA7E
MDDDNNKLDPGDELSVEFPDDHDDAPEPGTTENDTVLLPEPIPDDTDPAVVPSQVTAIIRTLTPMLVGWVVSVVVWALTPLGVSVPPSFNTWLEGALPVVLGGLYYLLAKWLERVAPSIPWLGSTRRPLYTPPATGGATYALATLANTGYVWYKGGKFSPEFRDALVELDRLTPDVPLVVTQGGYNGTAVAASAGTHAGDAVDFSVRGLTREQVAKVIEAGRKVGIFLSFRTTNVGKWGVRAQGFPSYHLHGVPNGWGAPSAGARRQIAYIDAKGVKHGYRNGRDGLVGNGPDVGPGHVSTYRLRTWWDYLAAKKAAPKPAPKPSVPATGAAPKPRVVVVDGQLGPQTIRALQTVLGSRYGTRTMDGKRLLPVDGVLGKQTYAALQRVLQYRAPKGWARWAANGVFNSHWVKRLQWYVGATLDGKWGPATTRKLQEKLNAGTF